MKKSLVILIAVALLGGAAFYLQNQNNSSNTTNTPSSNNSASSTGSNTKYKDGTYQGKAAETPYGTVLISVVVSGGKVNDINFLQMPSSDDRSVEITNDSQPKLEKAAIDAQSADIDFVTGATSTSYGYQESLQAALDQAKLS